MAIAASGAVSFSDLRTEFVGGSAAISYSDLYRGGSNIRSKAGNNTGVNLAASVPTSGTINIANFRSQAKGFRFTYTSGATNQNASALFGDDYAVDYPKEIVINSGVELGATSTSEEALQIDTGASGTITVTNNGTLSGAGGAAGSAGGDAFEADIACTLINNGLIRAGGGGGGTGGVGGNGSYTSTTTLGPYNSFSSHVHGAIWQTYPYANGTTVYIRFAYSLVFSGTLSSGQTSYTSGSHTYNRGYFNGLGGTNNDVAHWNISRTTSSTSNSSGGSGGAGGVGAGYNQSAASGSSGVAGGTNAGTGGTGGTGGGFGSAGSTGNTGANGNVTNGAAGSSGGAAGNYIRGLSFVTLTQSGTVQGGTA